MSDKPHQHEVLDQAIRRRLRQLADATIDVSRLKRRVLWMLDRAGRAAQAASRQGAHKKVDDRGEPW